MAVRLELERLEKRFGDVRVLSGVELAVEPGETLALLGPSGSGKTTALRIVAGFETADRGRVLVDGEDVSRTSPSRRRFGMVFQHYALFPHLSVEENVAFGLETRDLDREKRAQRIASMLELVGLPDLGGRRIGELSGGQQQRVALARALAPSPRVLLLDEPLSNLDPALRERTRVQLREAIDEVGITTVLVTHEQEEAFHLGDRVAVLHRGRLEQVGRPETLYRSPATRFVAGFVGRASEIPGRVETVHDGRRARVRIDGTDTVWEVLASGGGVVPGEPVVVAARPEALEVVEAGAPEALVGRPEDRRFTGPLTYHRLRLREVDRQVEIASPGDLASPENELVGIRPRPGTDLGPWAFPAGTAGDDEGRKDR